MRFAKYTQHDKSKVLRLPRKMTMDTSKVLRLPRKLQHIFWKRNKSIAPATQNDFRHVPEHVWMSRSATPATRNEATTRLKPPKRTTSAKLPIGTAIRGSRGRLQTVADGCGRLRPQTQRRANTPSTPRPPEWNGNPCYAFGKNIWKHQEILNTSKTYKMLTSHWWRSGTADGLQRIRSYYAGAMDGKVDALKLKKIFGLNFAPNRIGNNLLLQNIPLNDKHVCQTGKSAPNIVLLTQRLNTIQGKIPYQQKLLETWNRLTLWPLRPL